MVVKRSICDDNECFLIQLRKRRASLNNERHGVRSVRSRSEQRLGEEPLYGSEQKIGKGERERGKDS